jgi:hypothetical protein
VLWNLLHVYLAALRCTISSLLMLDLVWGSKTQLLYSNMISLIGYINNAVIKLQIYFNLHICILSDKLST